MRGHWESQTRKLNKHYQSGNGGTPVPPLPPKWEWEKFMAGGTCIPFKFMHDPDWNCPYACADNIYYNRVVSPSLSNYRPYYPLRTNFARCALKEGPVSPRYDGMVKGYKENISTGLAYEVSWYQDQIDLELRADNDPSGPSTHYVHLYKDLGWRYVKYRMPLYTAGPSYIYGHGDHNPNIKLAKTDVIKSDIRLSARACKAYAWESADRGHYYNLSQSIELENLSTHNTTLINVADADILNIFDLEVQGKSYLEVVATIAGITNMIIRAPLFIYNGEFYLDLFPHFYDPNTLEEITSMLGQYVITLHKFPNTLSGFCYGDPYYKPGVTFAPSTEGTPTYDGYKVAADPDTGLCESIVCVDYEEAEAYWAQLSTYVQLYQYFDYNGLVPIQLTEQEFDDAKAAWEALNPGT